MSSRESGGELSCEPSGVGNGELSCQQSVVKGELLLPSKPERGRKREREVKRKVDKKKRTPTSMEKVKSETEKSNKRDFKEDESLRVIGERVRV